MELTFTPGFLGGNPLPRRPHALNRGKSVEMPSRRQQPQADSAFSAQSTSKASASNKQAMLQPRSNDLCSNDVRMLNFRGGLGHTCARWSMEVSPAATGYRRQLDIGIS